MSANDRKGCQNPPRETWTLRDPQRTPERHGDIQRHLKTPGDTQTHLGGPSARETHFTYNVFFFFLYMFTEWTKFNKLNMILQPCIPTLKVPFFWSMFSLLKQLKTRKEKLYILIKVRTYLHVWSSVYRLLWQLVCTLQGWKFAPPHGGATSIGYNQEI